MTRTSSELLLNRALLLAALALALVGCAHPRPASATPAAATVTEFDLPPPPPEVVSMNASADQLVAARDFAGAVAVFEGGWAKGLQNRDSAYTAAGAAARGGLLDAGFEWLRRASQLGYHDTAHFEIDPELEALRQDPRWPAMHERLVQEADQAFRDEGATDLPLSQEIAEMVKEDQVIRLAVIHAKMKDPALNAREEELDRKHLPRLKELLEKHGWLGTHLVGRVGSKNTWLLVQHMDQAPEFQQYALSLMQPAAEAGEASKSKLAYLTDRVLRAEKKPQRYGTQFTEIDGTFMPQEMEEPEHVDERRRTVGLGTMVEAAHHMEVTYGIPALAVRKPGAVDLPPDK